MADNESSPRTGAALSINQSGLRSPRTPRRSITPKQAVNSLELSLTQANDLQHLFEKYIQQIDQQTITVRLGIDKQFDDVIKQLVKRKDSLHEKVGAWKTQKLQEITNAIDNAADYEQELLNAQKHCNDILNNNKLDAKQKQNQIKFIKKAIKIDEKYHNSTSLTQYINNMTNLIDINYQSNIAFNELSNYGNIVLNKQNNSISVPRLDLLTPIKTRESKSGFKLKVQWTASHALVAENFIVRCLTVNKNKNVHVENKNDDEKQPQPQKYREKASDNIWKSLIFQIKQTNEKKTAFEAEINSVFLFDKAYIFRIEYHVSEPVNLLIGSNEQQFKIENMPPSANKAEKIDLEYFLSHGYGYDGHPKYLLSGKSGKTYRSRPNKEFDYNETDWIVFKVKHSGMVRTYLPKAIIVKNALGTQGLKELVVSIGSKGDGKEWYKYNVIELESGDNYQQMLLEGVDWRIIKQMKTQYIRLELVENHGESRGAQCRFKVDEFKLYGLEFK